jgi:hypothetical protein
MMNLAAAFSFWLALASGVAAADQPARAPDPAIDLDNAGQTAIDIVKTSKDPEAKWRAVRILGSLHYKPAVPLLLESLSDSDANVRANAARALGDMRVAAATRPLTELLKKEQDGGVIQQTSLALANLGCSDALPVLKDAAGHKDEQTRMWVLQAIGRVGGKPDVRFLAGYLTDRSQSVQEMAGQAIEQIAGVDFGFPKESGPKDPRPAIQKAKSWWQTHQAEFADR